MFLTEYKNILGELDLSKVPLKSILRMLFANLNEENKVDFYKTYLPKDDFPEVYGSNIGLSGKVANVPLPELVNELTEYHTSDDELSEKPWHMLETIRELKMSKELIREMKTSLYPPHKIMRKGNKKIAVPNAAFPYCYYEDKDNEGQESGPYKAKFCDSFQVL